MRYASTHHTHDAAGKRVDRSRFARVRRAEATYARSLRGVARQVGLLARSYSEDDPTGAERLESTLHRYAETVRSWARAAAERMLADVDRRDEAAWAEASRGMARTLRQEIKSAPTGQLMRELLQDQVELITSLPLEAAQRVHQLTMRRLTSSGRAAEVAKEILRTGEVTVGRANLIARTETARTASKLVEARAVHIGSEGYIWRTSEDSDVRPLHKKLNGKFIRWDDPPVAGENEERAHAGQIYNCRCWPEPVVAEEA